MLKRVNIAGAGRKYTLVFSTCTSDIDSFLSASGRVVITKNLITELDPLHYKHCSEFLTFCSMRV